MSEICDYTCLCTQAGRMQPDYGVHAVVRGGCARLQQLPGHARRAEAHLLRAEGGASLHLAVLPSSMLP